MCVCLPASRDKPHVCPVFLSKRWAMFAPGVGRQTTLEGFFKPRPSPTSTDTSSVSSLSSTENGGATSSSPTQFAGIVKNHPPKLKSKPPVRIRHKRPLSPSLCPRVPPPVQPPPPPTRPSSPPHHQVPQLPDEDADLSDSDYLSSGCGSDDPDDGSDESSDDDSDDVSVSADTDASSGSDEEQSCPRPPPAARKRAAATAAAKPKPKSTLRVAPLRVAPLIVAPQCNAIAAAAAAIEHAKFLTLKCPIVAKPVAAVVASRPVVASSTSTLDPELVAAVAAELARRNTLIL